MHSFIMLFTQCNTQSHFVPKKDNTFRILHKTTSIILQFLEATSTQNNLLTSTIIAICFTISNSQHISMLQKG